MKILNSKFDSKCKACGTAIKGATVQPAYEGDRVRWSKADGVTWVTCLACPHEPKAKTPANGTPVAASDAALLAALADGQALRARIGGLAHDIKLLDAAALDAAATIRALREDVARMNAAAHEAAITIEGLRKERDRLTASLTHTQNVLGNVQRERAALVAAGHDVIDDGPELIDVMAPGGVERWLAHDLAQIAAEKAATDDDCPI
jgi:hypothetical protein